MATYFVWNCLHFIVYILLLPTVADSDSLSNANEPFVAIINSTLRLNCSTADSTARWELYTTSSTQPVTVYNGHKLADSFSRRHTVTYSSNQVSQLTINGVQVSDSGRYRCFSPTDSFNFELTVLASEPFCSSTIRAHGHNPNDVIKAQCQVLYEGNLMPGVECLSEPDGGKLLSSHSNKTRFGSLSEFQKHFDAVVDADLDGKSIRCSVNFRSDVSAAVYIRRNIWTSISIAVDYPPSIQQFNTQGNSGDSLQKTGVTSVLSIQNMSDTGFGQSDSAILLVIVVVLSVALIVCGVVIAVVVRRKRQPGRDDAAAAVSNSSAAEESHGYDEISDALSTLVSRREVNNGHRPYDRINSLDIEVSRPKEYANLGVVGEPPKLPQPH